MIAEFDSSTKYIKWMLYVTERIVYSRMKYFALRKKALR